MPLSRRKYLIHYSLFPPHMRPLFFATLLRNFADNLVGVFLPLFLFEIGSRLQLFAFLGVTPFVSGVLLAVCYYALQRLTMVIAAFPAASLIYRIGYVKAMTIGTFFLMLNYLGLWLSKVDPLWLSVTAICGGLFLFFYWTTHDSLFALEINVKEIGRGVGAMAFLTKLIQISTPAIAGVMIMIWGYETLFAVGILFLLLSLVPFIMVRASRIYQRPSLSQFLLWVGESRFRKFALVQIGMYMDIIAVILWPIYVLVLVGKIQHVGYLFSLALLLSLILTYLAGWFVDRKKGKRMFVASGVVISLSWFLRVFVRGIWDVLGVEFLEKLAGSVYSPCYDALLCQRAKGRFVFSFYVYKEFLLSLSAIVLWALVFGFFLLPASWEGVFILGAIGVGLSLFLDGRK